MNEIQLNKKELELLLESKKEYIGNKVLFDGILSGASFVLSALLGSYGETFGDGGIYAKIVFVAVGFFFSVKAICDTIKSVKNKYSYEDLMKDIGKLNKIEHSHYIIAIKNTFDKFPNKYLLYYDSRWDCKLFLNYSENADIIECLSNDLKIGSDNINIEYKAEETHNKFSESHKEYRLYHHTLLNAEIDIPKEYQKDTFTVDGKTYYWLSIADMEKDKRIQQVNSDVVNFVKRFN